MLKLKKVQVLKTKPLQFNGEDWVGLVFMPNGSILSKRYDTFNDVTDALNDLQSNQPRPQTKKEEIKWWDYFYSWSDREISVLEYMDIYSDASSKVAWTRDYTDDPYNGYLEKIRAATVKSKKGLDE